MGTELARRYGYLPMKLKRTERTLSVRASAKRARFNFLRKCSHLLSLLWRSGMRSGGKLRLLDETCTKNVLRSGIQRYPAVSSHTVECRTVNHKEEDQSRNIRGIDN